MLLDLNHGSGAVYGRGDAPPSDGAAITARINLHVDAALLARQRERRDWRALRGLIETAWGYAITCHKAQGSQWENVVVYDDGLSRTPEDRARWLYTAITRAERGLVLLD